MKLKKCIFLILGCICLALGCIGIVLPILACVWVAHLIYFGFVVKKVPVSKNEQ